MLNEIDENIGISKERYKLFFLMEDSFGIFRPKENVVVRDSKNYKCIYFQNHNCVSAQEVLLDILFSVRSGNELDIIPGDVVSVCVNGIIYSYKFIGFISLNPNKLDVNFEKLGTEFCSNEKQHLVNHLHKNGMVLDVLKGKVIHLKDKRDLKKYSFYGIENETYSFRPFNFIFKYNIYKLKAGKILNVSPNTSSFYNIRNVLVYYLKNCQSEKYSVLLFDRKELEMIKDYIDIDND